MKTLLIINGYAGAGKSTAAQKFAEKNDFALIKQDYFLFGINASKHLSAEDHSIAIQNMHDAALNYMRLSRDVVIEGALVSISNKDPLDVRDFITLGKRMKYKVVVVTFIADENTRLDRESKRGYTVQKEIDKMLREAIDEMDGKIEGEIIIDTSNKSPDDIVQELQKLV